MIIGKKYRAMQIYLHSILVAGSAFITSEKASEVVEIPFPQSNLANPKESCPHKETGVLDWNDPSIWIENTIPAPKSDVILPINSKVLITQSISYTLGIITIPDSSELIIGENASGIELNVHGINVFGALRAGSETCLIENPINIILHGERPVDITENPMPMSFKGIAVTGNGLLHLHGKKYFRTWTRLSETVKSGSMSLILQHKVNWEQGQEVVLVTTAIKDSKDFHQNEILTISSIESHSLPNLGSILNFNSPLKYTHLANSGYQAEVGLLSRIIKVSGSEFDSEPTDPDTGNCFSERSIYGSNQSPCTDKDLTGFGGHVIIAEGGKGYVEGTELYRMGQTNVLGRYPMHFHILGDDCIDCYIRHSSIHKSYYRCVSIHGTNGILVSENVAYDITGYCYYLEDGVEELNTLSYNLAALIHYIGEAPWGYGQNTDLSYQSSDLLLPADVTASGFYITNVHNNIVGNAASGGWSGFAFPVLHQPLGQHKSMNMRPSSRTALIIDGNTAHSTGWWWKHAGAFYFGGSLYFAGDGESLIYNAGRDQSHLRSPCYKDLCAAGNCDSHCSQEDRHLIPVTNSKVFLVPSVGFNSWSGPMEVIKYEAHDVGLGIEALASGFWIDQMLVVCRTGEHWQLPSNSYANKIKGDGFFWYDTNQKHIITNSTFRNCGYRNNYDHYDSSPTRGCDDSLENGCIPGSTTFGFLTHSDQHTPEQMQGTRNIIFDNCGRRFKLHNYHGDSSPSTVSGRGQNWIDFDGSVTGLNERSLIGSGQTEAGLWWEVDNEVVFDPQGPLKFIKQDNGPERSIAYFRLKFDNSLHAQVGSTLCGNGNLANCPAVGYIKHLGSKFQSDNGLPITANAEVVGPSGGFGWLLRLNDGAPHSLRIDHIEVDPHSPLMLYILYPPGTQFNIKANAAWCSNSNYYSCQETFHQVNSVEEVRNSLGNTYYVDSNGMLTVRVIQTSKTFTGNPDWIFPDYNTIGKWGSWYALDRFSRNGVFLPKFAYGPWLDILANCERGPGAYCARVPSSILIDVCPQGYVQTAYDKCCSDERCIYSDGKIEIFTTTSSKTHHPTWTPTQTSTKYPTWSPTKKPSDRNSPQTSSSTKHPTWSPTQTSTKYPTWYPTKKPLNINSPPTSSSSKHPTWSPTQTSKKHPTWSPTKKPSMQTSHPTSSSTKLLTWPPIQTSTKYPTWSPTKKPDLVKSPTSDPTNEVTPNPTKNPSRAPLTVAKHCCAWGGQCSNTDPNYWCNLSQTNCEGPCNGEYVDPNVPPAGGAGCCSWSAGICTHSSAWCDTRKKNCEKNCNGVWISE